MKCERLQECCNCYLNGSKISGCQRINSCIESSDAQKIVSCTEKNRTYRYDNTLGNVVIHYHVDGGIVDDAQSIKCDRLLVAGGETYIGVLVELKGNDVKHGIKQINETLNHYPEFFSSCRRVHARIVATKAVPDLQTTSNFVKLKVRLKSVYNGTLEVKTLQYREKDTELV